MGLSPSPTPPPRSSGSPNKSFNSKEITFLEVGILFGRICGLKLPPWARMWVRRMQAKGGWSRSLLFQARWVPVSRFIQNFHQLPP